MRILIVLTCFQPDVMKKRELVHNPQQQMSTSAKKHVQERIHGSIISCLPIIGTNIRWLGEGKWPLQ